MQESVRMTPVRRKSGCCLEVRSEDSTRWHGHREQPLQMTKQDTHRPTGGKRQLSL